MITEAENKKNEKSKIPSKLQLMIATRAESCSHVAASDFVQLSWERVTNGMRDFRLQMVYCILAIGPHTNSKYKTKLCTQTDK